MSTTNIDFTPRYNADGDIKRYVARPVGEGRLIDRTYNDDRRFVQSSGFNCTIDLTYTYRNVVLDEVTYLLCTSGREPGGTRYRAFRTLDEAINAAEKWAARRFGYINF